MARIRGRAGYKPQSYNKTEVFQWLKTLPLAPEFHPTLEEFQDPIAYIHKIEKEASFYGICKIIPPVLLPLRKNAILELNKSLLARSASPEGELKPTFTTRVQQVGFCPRKDHPVIKSVWESGKTYTVSEFEAKAKSFEKNYFKKGLIDKGVLSPLEIETLYWNANAEKPFDVEYANDLLGSAFVELDKRRGRGGLSENLNVGDTEWNLRGAARSKGCPLKFVKDDIPGVTSPMVYMGMMFSWFAWHVEDHDLHSLNYMHLGDKKTWYGVPKDAAVAFEEVIRKHGFGEEMNPILTCATLGKKTTIMSPEVILNAGIPCCRLVQNAGEFVVTFPRAYHSGFSHGFNCAEASNIATPEWLRYAREAAIRRAAVNCPPLVSHIQLLYDLALSFSSRLPVSIEPRSSRLKEKKKVEEEYLVKELFVQDVLRNTNLLHSLGKGSPAILFPHDFIEDHNIYAQEKRPAQCERLPNTGLFSCVACGVLCFACAAIIKPSEVDLHNLMSADCGNIGGRGVASEFSASSWWTRSIGDANNSALDFGLAGSCKHPSDVPEQCENRIRTNEIRQPASCSRPSKDTSSLALLALTYEDATDSESEPEEGSPVYGLDEDSSRSHVFCLQHAFEVEQKLRALGGVHILLICHPEYPKFLAGTKLMANELGADHIWSDISFRTATEEDKKRIKSAIDSEGSIRGNADWAAKLGVNLSYSANLSGSPLYRKQIPYNSVIYNAFGLGSSADIPAISELKQKKAAFAGKWCGKVWMSNQVHHLVAEMVHEEQEQVKEYQTLAKPQLLEPIVMPENPSKSQTVDLSSESSEATLKRKGMDDLEPTSRGKSPKVEESVKATDHTPKDKCIIQYKRTFKNKLKVKVIQEETPRPEEHCDQGAERLDVNFKDTSEGGPSTRLRKRPVKQPAKDGLELVMDNVVTKSSSENLTCNNRGRRTSEIKTSAGKRNKKSEESKYSCNIEGCIMNFGSKQELVLHKRNICSVTGCRKNFVSHKYLIQHQKVHIDERPLKCPWKGCTKTFKWDWARTEHIRIHTGARPYTCGETGCGKTFRFVSDFSRHKRKTGHSGKLEESSNGRKQEGQVRRRKLT